MQTMKRLLKKADESKQDELLALLDFCNSPISGMEVSPAELLMGRTRLPTFKSLLESKTRPLCQVCQKLLLRQQHQKAYYGLGTWLLSTQREGKSVRIQQGRELRSAVVAKQHQAPCSYIVASWMECKYVGTAYICSQPRRSHLQPWAQHGN